MVYKRRRYGKRKRSGLGKRRLSRRRYGRRYRKTRRTSKWAKTGRGVFLKKFTTLIVGPTITTAQSWLGNTGITPANGSTSNMNPTAFSNFSSFQAMFNEFQPCKYVYKFIPTNNSSIASPIYVVKRHNRSNNSPLANSAAGGVANVTVFNQLVADDSHKTRFITTNPARPFTLITKPIYGNMLATNMGNTQGAASVPIKEDKSMPWFSTALAAASTPSFAGWDYVILNLGATAGFYVKISLYCKFRDRIL